MPENTVMLFTGRPPQQILDEGGSQAWVLSPLRARKCTYVVCVQNRQTLERFSPTEPHNRAFMIGKITEVDLSEEQPDPSENKPARYIVKFSEYATVDIDATLLRNGDRNPVTYIDIMDLGIDVGSLKFKSVGPPSPNGVNVASGSEDQALTIAQARRGLALGLGVPPEAIEITIRG
jgi:hypothetical protein